VFWRGFGEGAGLNNPVTEPKRSQNPKRPPPYFFPTEYLQYFLNRSSDAKLELVKALQLSTFEYHGRQLIKRMAWVVEAGRITKVFYPVFPPDKNADEVLNWLKARRETGAV
jgi:hypothetical protein